MFAPLPRENKSVTFFYSHGLYGPKFENLERIAAVLKVPVKELFDFESE